MLEKAHTVVIKIGSSLLVDATSGQVHRLWLDSVVDDIATLVKQGKKIVLVSSGAVGIGKNYLSGLSTPLKLEEKQAAAACGQVALVQNYQHSLSRHHLIAAQLLLTLADANHRLRYLHARNTLHTLLKHQVIPVINENDSVTTAELRVGDNDRLAARVAQMVGADLLIILSNIEGLYTSNPHSSKEAQFIETITAITPEIEAMASGPSDLGSGGMRTKIEAAKIATASGCHMIITQGQDLHPIKHLQQGGKATLFISQDSPKNAWKRFILGQLSPLGTITIDEGACRALQRGNSLLPAGISHISGHFKKGDAVLIINTNKEEIGRGLVAYGAEETQKIIGKQSDAIESILGYSGSSVLIHRNNLVLTK